MKLKEIKKALSEYIIEAKGTSDQWGICGRYGYSYNYYLEYISIYEAIEIEGNIHIEEYFFDKDYQIEELGFKNFFDITDKTRFNKIRKLLNELYY